jgi:phospholipid/cholesterol/gamma-HCH transport system ATP-binding protein
VTAGEPVIEVRGLCKAFDGREVFDGLDLTVFRGETLTILGGSGSGKSVLLKLIIGLLEADRGEIRVFGQDLVALSEDERLPLRARIAMLFQGGALFDSLSVADNLAYPLRRQPRFSPEAIPARIAEVLELVGLPGIGDMLPAALSGGMRKRVALARAIAPQPEVVLYDEPTTGLDPLSTRRIDDLIRSINLRMGITSIVVTHDLPSAFLISDRIAFLADGRIHAVEDRRHFMQSPDPAIRSFLEAMPIGLNGGVR